VSDDGDALDDSVERLHAELEATEELPVDRTASRWIGEAQAVAADAARGDLSETVVRERVGHVAQLLENVETTGDEGADRHVVTARELAADIVGAD
jgi:hypothetical protein